jgi:hypothetical protein
MRILVAAIVLVLAMPAARADDGVGVVVTGDEAMQPAVAKHLEKWLKKHGLKLITAPLSGDAVTTMTNCLVAEDSICARGVVEHQSKADNIVFARIDVAAKGDHNVTFVAYWIVKGHEAIGERRVCEQCTDEAWHQLADRMMVTLRNAATVGRVEVKSKPPGLTVLIDNSEVGVTPVERELPAGEHAVDLSRAGKRIAHRSVTIKSGDVARVAIDTHDDGGGGSHLVPLVLLGGGAASLAASSVFFYYGFKSGPNEKYTYAESSAWGIGLAAIGVGAAVAGVVLWKQGGSAPVASIGPHGGYVGWITRF